LVKSHNLLLSLAIVTSKQSITRANKKQAKKRRTEKRGRIKRQGGSGGEENERQMANNVMRVIRVCDGYLVCWLLRRLPGNGARNLSCYLLSTALVFPWRGKGDAVKQRKYFPQFWEPRHQSSTRPPTSLSPLLNRINPRNQCNKGVVNPFTVTYESEIW